MATISITVKDVRASTMPLAVFVWNLCHRFSTSSLHASFLRSKCSVMCETNGEYLHILAAVSSYALCLWGTCSQTSHVIVHGYWCENFLVWFCFCYYGLVALRFLRFVHLMSLLYLSSVSWMLMTFDVLSILCCGTLIWNALSAHIWLNFVYAVMKL